MQKLEVGRSYTGIGGPYRCMQILPRKGDTAALLEREPDHLVFEAQNLSFRGDGSITWTKSVNPRWLRIEL